MSAETGKLIKAKLKELGKTQGWLAEQITVPGKDGGVSINAVSKWTKTGKIARAHVQQVADILGVSADQLLSGAPLLELAPPSETTIERLDAEEKKLIDLYRASTKAGHFVIMNAANIAPKLPARLLRRPN